LLAFLVADLPGSIIEHKATCRNTETFPGFHANFGANWQMLTEILAGAVWASLNQPRRGHQANTENYDSYYQTDANHLLIIYYFKLIFKNGR